MTVQIQHEASCPSHPTIPSQYFRHLWGNAIGITFGQRYLAISLIIAQSAFLCSLFAWVDSLSKSFFAAFAPAASLGGWVALPSANEGTADGPGFTAVGSVPSVDWLCNRPQEVNTRSCAAFGLVHGALRAKLGCAYRAGRQHGDRAALSSMAACKQDKLSKEVRM